MFVPLGITLVVLFQLFACMSGKHLQVGGNSSEPRLPPCSEVSVDILWARLNPHDPSIFRRSVAITTSLGSDPSIDEEYDVDPPLDKSHTTRPGDIDVIDSSANVGGNNKGEKGRRLNLKKSSMQNIDSSEFGQLTKVSQVPKENRSQNKRHHTKKNGRFRTRGGKSNSTAATTTSNVESVRGSRVGGKSRRHQSTRKSAESFSRELRQLDDSDDQEELKYDDSEVEASMQDKPPWHCAMKPDWVRMEDDTIPLYVRSGICIQRSCDDGAYECVPKKYIVKVLKKLKNICYPVPASDNQERYEEAWAFVEHEITVACECSRKRGPGIYSANWNSPG